MASNNPLAELFAGTGVLDTTLLSEADKLFMNAAKVGMEATQQRRDDIQRRALAATDEFTAMYGATNPALVAAQAQAIEQDLYSKESAALEADLINYAAGLQQTGIADKMEAAKATADVFGWQLIEKASNDQDLQATIDIAKMQGADMEQINKYVEMIQNLKESSPDDWKTKLRDAQQAYRSGTNVSKDIVGETKQKYIDKYGDAKKAREAMKRELNVPDEQLDALFGK